ncbi:hypothetical protein [Arthrobacter sp. Cr_A7]|uniref:hypothetical protein n=1 Tax=Arthrobacter sp. Cr_A7 TaxID=3031017 RepID=UPI0023DA5346|nr:hypothetical protein [Arthrobacter sp. Cr_A7]MDF2051646.1 hypothetical protein [Arthrobacter sp. Cr_A7]
MSIQDATITAILDSHHIPEEFRHDPELRAAAYALAFLDEPAGGAEERFYNSDTALPGDTPDAPSYQAGNRGLLTEIYCSRVSLRLGELYAADLEAWAATAP